MCSERDHNNRRHRKSCHRTLPCIGCCAPASVLICSAQVNVLICSAPPPRRMHTDSWGHGACYCMPCWPNTCVEVVNTPAGSIQPCHSPPRRPTQAGGGSPAHTRTCAVCTQGLIKARFSLEIKYTKQTSPRSSGRAKMRQTVIQ
jgi:hypothetical protein